MFAPFLVGAGGPEGSGRNPEGIDGPIGTVMAANHRAVVEPMIMSAGGPDVAARSVDEPLNTVLTRDHMAVCEPCLINLKGGSIGRSIDEPIPTQTASVAHQAVAEPWVIVNRSGNRPHSVDEPIAPLCTGNHIGIAEPHLVAYRGSHAGKADGDRRVSSVDEPLKTLDTSNRYALARPYLVRFNGTSTAQSIDEPLGTIDTRDRFALVHPEVYDKGLGQVIGYLDIRFRMLKWHELAAAHSFDPAYKFAGNDDKKVKQIGNSVPVETARALCREILK